MSQKISPLLIIVILGALLVTLIFYLSKELTISPPRGEVEKEGDVLTKKTATLPSGRIALACAENSATHKIYCFGGLGQGGFAEILEYDPARDIITTKEATLPTEIDSLACAEDSATHKIYCFGGVHVREVLDEILEYDPATDTVTIKEATLPSARALLACAENSATHKIYCFGGASESSVPNEILEYNPPSGYHNY